MARSDSLPHSVGENRIIPLSAHEKGVMFWFEKNKSQISLIAGACLLVIVGILLFVSYQRYRKATALEELRLGVSELQSGSIENAVERLQTAESLLSPETKSGKVTSFYLGEAIRRSGSTDSKEENTGDISGHTAAPQDYISQIALLTQGRIAEGNKDFVSAQKRYEEASVIEGPFTSDALLGAARMAESNNDKNAAIGFREKFIETFPNSPFTELVRDKLSK